ncbi:MAG: methyl-accepting chemotaxis protein [Desulfuromusa sp.]|nr:methyl-accepting chemotaxis protein [Desulfuromusa sp.]
MASQSTQQTSKLFSIRNKLILISCLFFGSFLISECLGTYSDNESDKATATTTLREHQIATLNLLEISITEFTLAGMDAIIDKGDGKIAPELKDEMAEASKICRKIIPTLPEIADTAEESRLAKEIISVYDDYEKAVLTDLPRLITSQADEAAFAEIDDRIDNLLNKIDKPLMAIIDSVAAENVEAREEMHQMMDRTTTIRRLFATGMIGVVTCLIVFIGRSILQPIKSTTLMLRDVAQGEGDLTKRLDVSNDELGDLAGWFNTFIAKLQTLIQQLQENLTTLDQSSNDLSTIAESLESGAENATGRSNTVASAAEEMSSNMNAVAAASEQASVNINMVASGSEEMTATVNEIAGNTEKARSITEDAVTKTASASQRVDELGGAAREISKVTEVITEISEQTNLLALNATIEAARAGEAGKGFAVVANEIKELAKQTATATQEIKQKIESIQSSTDHTVNEISQISSVISEVNDLVSGIATAVEEQSASSKEISDNISQAAQGISEVNENVSQSSAVAGEIAQEIAEISQVAGDINSNSVTVNSQSTDLTNLAAQLNKIAQQFKV